MKARINDQKTVVKNPLQDVLHALPGVDNEAYQELAALLSLEDKDFKVLSAIFLEEMQRSLNRPEERLMMIQSLNATGTKVEDIIGVYAELMREIDEKMPATISQIKVDFLKALLSMVLNTISETEGIAKKIIQVPLQKCHPDAIIPKYAKIGDAGMDVFSLEDYTVLPGQTVLVKTGIKMAIPKGYEMQVRPKSGISLKTGLRVANTPGTIDSGYRDEIGIIIENIESPIQDITYTFGKDKKPVISSILHGKPYVIEKGQKIAQLVLKEVPMASFVSVSDISILGEDRGGGFGSTGLKEEK